jgi:hypothetical protein
MIQGSNVQKAVEDDPDYAIPSVEQDALYESSRASTPSTTSTVSDGDATTETIMKHDSVQTETEALRALTLASTEPPHIPTHLRNIWTPPICISKPDTCDDRAGRSESLIAALDGLHVATHPAITMLDSSEAEKHSLPPQSRRRRSASAANMRRHQVEDEHPPETAFHVPEVQQALSDVRSVVSRMVDVLSTSKLHLGRSSSVRSLHQKAIELERCQIPSSRIVGLVGDSGVGKSSLINSLLDKNGFAKAVSDYFMKLTS